MSHEHHSSEARLLTDRLRQSVAPGERYEHSMVIVEREGRLQMVIEGVVLRQRFLADGSCQTTAMYSTEDVINLCCFVRPGDHNDQLVALNGTTIASVEPAAVAEFRQMAKGGVDGMAALVSRELGIAQQWLLSLGQRRAATAMAHFFCETMIRSRPAKIDDPERQCSLPLTQQALGEILGISSVHVNRTLQRLRGEGLADHLGGVLVIDDFPKLAAFAGFDPTYLAPI
jgi:CRP-like cAMP-binding protein